MRPFLAKKLAAITGQSLAPDGILVVPAAITNTELAATQQVQQMTMAEMSTQLLNMANLLKTVMGGAVVAQNMQQLYQLIQQDIASDATTAADFMAQVTSVQQALGSKANASTVQSISTKLNTTADGLATVQSAVDTQKGRVDGLLQTTVPALQTAVESKLSKAGDTATGQIKGPVADATALGKTAYPRFEQVLGGINQPSRIAQNVGSTPVAFDPLTDTTGLNRKVMPVNVIFLLTEMPPTSLLGSVTLKIGTTAGGSEVYSKNVSTSLLSGVLNKLTAEVPSTALQLNAGSVLYATVTSSGGGSPGKWVAYVLSVFIPNAS